MSRLGGGTWRGILAAILLALASHGSLRAGIEEDFSAANKAHAEGDYAAARRGYELVLARGPRANVLFNLGNACFRLGDFGSAALAYERALLLEPRQPDATANLKLAREKAGARITPDRWWERVLLWFAPGTATAIAVGACWFFLLLGGSVAWRRKGVGGLVACGLGAALTAGYAGGVHWARRELGEVAIVIAPRAVAHQEPAERSAKGEAIPAASRVQVFGEHAGWTYCRLPAGQRGWLPDSALEFLVPRGKSSSVRS
jgi:hypothetical protein